MADAWKCSCRGEDYTKADGVFGEKQPPCTICGGRAAEQVERVARRLFFEFSTETITVWSWERMSDAAKESWRVSARRVLGDVDRDA